jgi:hypothetical protein
VLDREVARRQEERRRLRSLEQPLVTHQPDEEGQPRRLLDLLLDPTSPIPEEVVASAAFQCQLAAILRQLPETWREPFLLHVRARLFLKQAAVLEEVPSARCAAGSSWRDSPGASGSRRSAAIRLCPRQPRRSLPSSSGSSPQRPPACACAIAWRSRSKRR